MREILFRGKRTDNGEWVTGTPFIYADRCKMIQAVAVHPDFVDEGNVYYSEGFPVDTKTVGQFTGLTDKNGTKIFEGDIVEHHIQGDILVNRGVVNWDEESARWAYQLNTMNPCFALYNPNAFEVIGNIHDNPELIGGNDNA